MSWFEALVDFIDRFRFWVVILPWEMGLRVRLGKKVRVLKPGIYLTLPFYHTTFTQPTRLRIISMSPQTVQTKDGKVYTVSSALGYTVSDIEKLYANLHHPEETLVNLAKSLQAEYLSTHSAKDCTPRTVEKWVNRKLKSENNGINVESFRIQTFAEVKTYRLIMDTEWGDTNNNMEERV